ncbi:MAG TPA: DUF924 family protein [Rhodanobacteraceae bacterium]|nr:DUF924 family protein [Rhodanobacteraceae bacterium]
MVDYWRTAGPAHWFAKDGNFDRDTRDRYLALHEAVASGALHDWEATPAGALALLILLDQFPRNAFRGTSRMYATDPLARGVARRMVSARFDLAIPSALRVFCYLPFAHSESVDDQRRSIELHRALGDPWLGHALRHQSIIEQFGRFPHRNAILGRVTTPAEQAYLDHGGFAG